MITFLIVAGCLWLSVATLFVIALACAARRRMPSMDLPPAQMTAFNPATSSSNSFAGKQSLSDEDQLIARVEEDSAASALPENVLVSSPVPSGMRE